MGGGTRPHRGDAEERRGREDPFEIRGNRRTRRGCGRCGKAHDGASWRAIGVWREVWTSGTVLWTTGPRPPHESTGAAARRFSTTAPTPSPHLLHRVVHTVRDEAVKTSFWTVFLGSGRCASIRWAGWRGCRGDRGRERTRTPHRTRIHGFVTLWTNGPALWTTRERGAAAGRVRRGWRAPRPRSWRGRRRRRGDPGSS